MEVIFDELLFRVSLAYAHSPLLLEFLALVSQLAILIRQLLAHQL